MYETEESSVGSGSYIEQDDMGYFLNRCSICFDAPLDLCLDYCKDQYCIDCFQKYISEVVTSSWGLSVTPIKCPVCTELIPKHEWSRYVPRKITEIYERFNKPYRSFTRSCLHCETEITPYSYNNYRHSTSVCDRLQDMLDACMESHNDDLDHSDIQRWISIYKKQQWTDGTLPIIYKHMINDILKFEKKHIKDEHQGQFAYHISLEFINFYVKPEIWKQIQFLHINFFPNMNCSDCKASICLHCGYDTHLGSTCQENMDFLISNKLMNKDMKEILVWQLKNSQRCPNCSIMINRDEGCNKVDCSYCGFCFCWSCKSSWAEGCGFYRCSIVESDEEENYTSMVSNLIQEKTEVGVPNVNSIQSKLTSRISHTG